MLELCRSPVIWSAMTADSRLSTAASRATVNADGNRGSIKSVRNVGMAKGGSPVGIPPNLLPIVSIGIGRSAVASVARISATIAPGIFLVRRGIRRITARDATPTPIAAPCAVPICSANTLIRPRKSPGTRGVVKPRKSFICVEAIRSAIPFVNPIVTGRGINLTAVPSPTAPITIRIAPAIRVTINSPERPNLAMIPATITTNAPVGPPICVREPPRAEIRNPPTTAV